MEMSAEWLGLMIGNSHLHWAYFKQDILIKTWQTNHLDCSLNFPIIRDLPILIPPKVGGLGGRKHTVNQDSLLNCPILGDLHTSIPSDVGELERQKYGVNQNGPLNPPILGDLQTSIPPKVEGLERRKDTLDQGTDFSANIPLYLASVVPKQTELFLDHPALKLIQLTDIPFKNLYPTLGIDRALAVLGSGENYGYPSLVIDGGTALTFTGVNQNQELSGGAILPGLGLQFQALSTKTAALPHLNLPKSLPIRWAMNTEDAIASGILYNLLSGIMSFIQDWLNQFPESKIIFTGGDGERLLSYLNEIYPDIADYCKLDPNLIFWGMRSLKNR
jgi:type III pantothenate kinase